MPHVQVSGPLGVTAPSLGGADPRPADGSGPPASSAPVERRRRLILLICSFSLFMAQLDVTAVNVGLPAIGRDLHAGIAGLQWVVNGFVLALGCLVMSSGAAGDRLGRRRVFRFGLISFTLASVACGLAPSLGMLIAFRVVQGAGASMLMPVTLSIIANAFPEPARRAEAIGVWAGAAGLSAAAGPLIGGALVAAVGWRAIFWVNLPIGVLAVALTTRFVPESRASMRRPADMPGQVAIAAFIGLLTYALIQAPAHGWGSPRTVSLLVATAAALVVFAMVELRTAAPLLDVRLLRRGSLAGAVAVALLSYLALMGFLFINTLYLQQVRGLSPVPAGLVIVPFPGALVLVSPLAGRWLGRRGPRGLIAAGGAAIAIGMLALLGSSAATPYPALIACYLLLGAGWGLLNAPITNIAISALPAAQAGVASAIAGTSRQVGAVLGVALLGSLTTTRFHQLLGEPTAPGISRPVAETAARAFTAATHLGYLVAAFAALLIIPLAATAPRARRPARRSPADATEETP